MSRPSRRARKSAGVSAASGASAPSGGKRYLALDGYRGAFVLIVIAYHFGATWLVGGWVGINHFFVLSGFLLTRLLVKERQRTGRIDAPAFYLRRARRVLPPMFVLVMAVLVHLAIVADPVQRRQVGGDAFATLGFFLNWRLISRDDAYFDRFGSPSPLRHAWTLSVEEQFYVLVPFLALAVLALTWRRFGRAGVFVALAVLSAWWTAHLGYHTLEDQARLYYGTDTRAQALLLGCALGVLLGVGSDGRGPVVFSRPLMETVGVIGAVFSFAIVFLLDENSAWVYNRGGMFLFALAPVLFIWASLDPRGLLVQRLFSLPVLVLLGRMSYGLYLYHWPIHLWVTPPGPALVVGLVQFALTFAVAYLSYRYLETPILSKGLRALLPSRRWRRSLPLRRTAAWGCAAALFVGSGVAWRSHVAGLPDDVPPLVAGTAPYHAGTPQQVALVGDSVGSSLAAGFSSTVYSDLQLHDNTMLGCDLVPAPLTDDGHVFPVSSHCAAWRDGAQGRLTSAKDKTLVIMGDAHFLSSHVLAQGTSTARTEAGAKAIRMALDDWQRRATAAGVTHTVIVNLPCRRIDPARLDASVRFFAAQGSDDAAVDWANGVMAQWVREHPGTQIADLHAHLCQGGFHPALNGVNLYKDTLHFSERGAVMVWTWLAPIVQAAARG